MKVLTKRNAMLGWATWKAAKGIAKYHKAKDAVPTKKKTTSKKKKAARVAGAAAAVGGLVLLKRKRRGGHSHGADFPSSSE